MTLQEIIDLKFADVEKRLKALEEKTQPPTNYGFAAQPHEITSEEAEKVLRGIKP